jgi:hypothetical protein
MKILTFFVPCNKVLPNIFLLKFFFSRNQSRATVILVRFADPFLYGEANAMWTSHDLLSRFVLVTASTFGVLPPFLFWRAF